MASAGSSAGFGIFMEAILIALMTLCQLESTVATATSKDSVSDV